MPSIEVDIETAQRLAAQAPVYGVSPSEYLRSIVPPVATIGSVVASSGDLDAELERLTLKLPTLPDDFSRADIYDDHD
jgi:hypothetical protein